MLWRVFLIFAASIVFTVEGNVECGCFGLIWSLHLIYQDSARLALDLLVFAEDLHGVLKRAETC